MKETFYFSHDYNAREDSKILNMLSELGWEGYGLYWALIEKLAEANGKLLLSDVKGIAFSLKIDLEKISTLITNFSLFENDEVYFWSNRLLSHLAGRQKIAKIRAKLGRKGGLATAKQLVKQGLSKINQSKVKESKGKERINTLVRGTDYKPDFKKPIKRKVILTDKQKDVVKRMRCLSYFHDKGVEAGFEYLLEEDVAANKKFLGLARQFEKRYPENWTEVIDWWFGDDNAWCDYRPAGFFSINTYMKFDNKLNNAKSSDHGILR